MKRKDDQKKILETKRLILRPWEEADAAALYALASDPAIGPNAGWRAHESEAYSLGIIRTVFRPAGNYAVTLKGGENKPVGAIGMTYGESPARGRRANEAETGYWIGASFQRQGYATEALQAVLADAFLDAELSGVWLCYYDGNAASKRVAEKAGFVYTRTDLKSYNPMLGKTFVEHHTYLSRESFFG